MQERNKQADSCLQLQAQLEALQAPSDKIKAAEAAVGAAEAAAGAAEQQVQEARACAAEEVKRRDELVQTHAAELAQLQQRFQAAQA